MIHQMMTLMHLEMQLRQQALVSYQEAQDPSQRMQRLDDVMALNEQLSEVGSILSMLLNAPLDRGAAVVRLAGTTGAEWQVGGPGRHAPPTTGGRFAPHRERSPLNVGGRIGGRAAVESALDGSLSPRFRFHLLDTELVPSSVSLSSIDSNDEDDNDSPCPTAVYGDNDDGVSYSASDVADNDEFDEDFGRADSSSGNSMWNHNDFYLASPSVLTSSGHRQHRSSAACSVSGRESDDHMQPTGINVSAGVGSDIGHPSAMVSGNGMDDRHTAVTIPVSSASTSRSHPSVMLNRRRDQPSVTPRRATVDQSPVNITVSELHSSDTRVQFPTGPRTATPQTVTLPQIQLAAGAVAAASRAAPSTPSNDHMQHLVGHPGRRQFTAGTSSSSSSTPRYPEPRSRNRLLGTSSQQTLPANSHVASHGGGSSVSGTGGINAYQQANHVADSSQPSNNSSGVLTEPWPVFSTTHQSLASASVSTHRSTIAQPVSRHDESRLPHSRGTLARNTRPLASSTSTAAAHGPRRGVTEMHSNQPALQLQRSSVRNSLSRATGLASISTGRPSGPHSSRMVPLPHPSVRGGQQHSLSDHSTSGSGPRTSNDMLRSRRRSEIAHEIMFPPQKDTEQ